MLVIMGYIDLDPADVDAFVSDIRAISSSTKAEKGCLFYSIALDDGLAGRFVVAQRWQDRQALAAHIEKRETLAFLTAWKDKMKSDLHEYEVLSGQPLIG